MPHQDLGNRVHGFLVFGDDADVENGGENENEAGGRGGTWKQKEEGLVENEAYNEKTQWYTNTCTDVIDIKYSYRDSNLLAVRWHG